MFKSFSSKFLLAFAPTLILGSMSFAPAMAQSNNYDGYCYSKKSDRATEDALVGGAVGAAAGTLLSKKDKKKKGAVVGGAVGAGVGYLVGREAAKKVKCYGDRYYVFANGFYQPEERAKFRVVFFDERPEGKYLYVIKNGREVPYTGN
jgi:hypothetical protein